MILYYSGNPTGKIDKPSIPEDIYAPIILSYALMNKKPSKRFKNYIKKRKTKK